MTTFLIVKIWLSNKNLLFSKMIFPGLDQWNFVMHPVDAAFTCDPQGTYSKLNLIGIFNNECRIKKLLDKCPDSRING